MPVIINEEVRAFENKYVLEKFRGKPEGNFGIKTSIRGKTLEFIRYLYKNGETDSIKLWHTFGGFRALDSAMYKHLTSFRDVDGISPYRHLRKRPGPLLKIKLKDISYGAKHQLIFLSRIGKKLLDDTPKDVTYIKFKYTHISDEEYAGLGLPATKE